MSRPAVGGPPPPGVEAVALAGLASWLPPFRATWFDRHRSPRSGQA